MGDPATVLFVCSASCSSCSRISCLLQVLSPREVSELMGVMAEKGLRLRTDIYEILLQKAGQ